TGNEVGATFLTAQKDGVTSNTANVDITGAVITALTVTPADVHIALGYTEQLTAIATFSDGNTTDVSDSVTWLVDDTNTATVAPSGLLASVSVGKTIVLAAKDEVISNDVNVNVTAAILLDVTVSNADIQLTEFYGVQLQAYAHYSDGVVDDITNTAIWSSGLNINVNEGLVEIDTFQDGYVTELSVTYNGMTSEKTIVTMRESEKSDVFGTETNYGVFISADSHSDLKFHGGVIVDGIYDNDTGELLAGDNGGWRIGDIMIMAKVKGDLTGVSSLYDSSTETRRVIKSMSWTEEGTLKEAGTQGTAVDPVSDMITIQKEVFGIYVFQADKNVDISGIIFIYK
ncbi:Ig-like domain-containing protein, partial [Shewanella sp. MMG014]|uniref:Ig-like domain-containing protein n=1 Tax=Shewanella sp. MMG014 TaxID=2822691 RepID=UPI001B374BB6